MAGHNVLRCAASIVGLALSAFLIFGGLSGTAQAQITWGNAMNIAADSNVSTVGNLVYAYDWNNGSGTTTLNGVSFIGVGGSTSDGNVTIDGVNYSTANASPTNPMSAGSSLDANYQAVLGGVNYNVTTIGLQDLTSGHSYAVEVWSSDSRSDGIAYQETTYGSTGGNSVSLSYCPSNVAGGAGQYAIGTFVANGTAQTIDVSGNHYPYVNALELRDLSSIGYWAGADPTNPALWDNATSNNFVGGLSLTPTTFISAQAPVNGVTFADTYPSSSGTTSVTQSNITIADAVSTGTVSFQNNAVSYTFSSSGANGISGSTAVNLTGSGMVTFNGPNTYTGPTTINSGTLVLGNSAAVQNSTVTVIAANGLQFSAGLGTALLGGLAGSGSFALDDQASNPVTIVVGSNNANTVYSGAMSGGGGLTKTGTGMLTLSGVNSYSGSTTVSGGTLAFGPVPGGGAGNILGSLAINPGATVIAGGNWNLGWNGGVSVNTVSIDHGTMIFSANPGGGGIAASSITMTGGTISSGGGGNTMDWYYGNSYNPTLNTLASPDHAVISATVNLRLASGANNLTFNVAQGTTSDGVDLLVSGNIISTGQGDSQGGIIKTGAGTMVLGGNNTYTGATSVNAGNLYVNGSLSTSSAVSVGAGATLGGQGSVGPTTVQDGGILEAGQGGVGSLTLNSLSFLGSATINVTPNSNIPSLNVTGNNGLTVSGGSSVTINIGTTTLSVGGYPLIGYSGALQGGDSSAFMLGTEPSGDGQLYALKNVTGSSSFIELFVAANAPYWTGANGTAWDTSTQNWQIGGAGGTPSKYSDGLAVVFDDSATGGTVAINGSNVTPASVTFSNNTLAYTLQGTSAISGSTGLTKNGTATLTIANVNSFTGPVNFNGGTIAVNSITNGGQNSPLGAGTSLAFGGGTLEYTGTDATPSTDRSIALNNGGGNVQVDNPGTMLMLAGSIAGPSGLTKTGPGGLTLGNSANSFGGNVTINGGMLAVPSIANMGVNSALAQAAPSTWTAGAWSTPAWTPFPAQIGR